MAPSNDITGQTDAINIKNALESAKLTGARVLLSDGDPGTADIYYVSRTIRVVDFRGTLEGESMDGTLILVGRQSSEPNHGFQPAPAPWWGCDTCVPNVIQLDYVSGNLRIANFAMQVVDENPLDPYVNYYGEESTRLSTFIENLGGVHNSTYENLRFIGALSGNPPSEIEDAMMNIGYGLHDMLGDPGPVHGKGDLTVRNIEAENIDWGVVLTMKRENGSKVLVDGVRGINVGQGAFIAGIFDSTVTVTNVDVALHSLAWTGLQLGWGVDTSTFTVTDNTISGTAWHAINLAGVRNSLIARNTFIDFNDRGIWDSLIMGRWAYNNTIRKNRFINVLNDGSGTGAIALVGGSAGNRIVNNDYSLSGLPGYVDGANGCILLGARTSNNLVAESVGTHGNTFPPGTNLCTPQVVDFGSSEVAGYAACANNGNWGDILNGLRQRMGAASESNAVGHRY